jgi:2-polyprenyl-6-hydroxyphenyl methylase/3-demethylubiquinone-9 3-methyltransferase
MDKTDSSRNVTALHQSEVRLGERFEFGKNWQSFLDHIDQERIDSAQSSLTQFLGVDSLAGKAFLDIGSGSGLFSLAARRLGATVYSLDFDPACVECARTLRDRYFPNDDSWTIKQGSVLDTEFIASLPKYDVVYSWGVLHHTGRMWEAIDNAANLVGSTGKLYIALYNDQGGASRRWHKVKQIYNKNAAGRAAMLSICIPYFMLDGLLVDFYQLANPISRYTNYKSNRGMSRMHDYIDWIGGYPFEVSKPEQIFEYCKQKGFTLERLKTCGGGLGCNEFLFIKK